MKIPIRYLPKKLNNADKKKQASEIIKSRKLYKQNKYYTRKNVKSFVSKPSGHISNAQRIYKIQKITPNRELAQKTGCSISSLQKIMKKGEGAYYSSGSRPNQTPQSWGYARLASSLTAGKAAAVDFTIIEEGCDHNKKAYRLAKSAKRKYGFGNGKTKKISVL
jgi:DNA-binding Xre family transcriptional regulator